MVCIGTYLLLTQAPLTKLYLPLDGTETSDSELAVYMKQTLMFSRNAGLVEIQSYSLCLVHATENVCMGLSERARHLCAAIIL